MSHTIEEMDAMFKAQGIPVEDRVDTHYSDDDFVWPDLPNKKKLAPLPPAPLEAMPAVLRDMCHEISETFQSPICVPMLNALSVAGFSAGPNYLVKIGGVKVRPNIYALTFQSPAEKKSCTFEPLVAPLEAYIKSLEDDWRDLETDLEIRKGKIQRLKKKIINGDGELGDREEIRKLENEPEPVNPNFILAEGTGAGIAEQMRSTGGKLFYASADAKDALDAMMGKWTEGKTDIGLMLKSYDGDTYSSGRRNKDNCITIDNPFMGICLVTQVNQIENMSQKADLFSAGLMSRFTVCLPDALAGTRDDKGNLVRAFRKREMDNHVIENYGNLLKELLHYAGKTSSPTVVPIDTDAEEAWIEFQNTCEASLGPKGQNEDCKDVAARRSILALRLALMLALCRDRGHGTSVVSLDVQNGIKLAEYYWKHMERALEMMAKRSMPPLVRRIIKKLKKDNTNILRTSPMLQHLSVKAEDLHDDAIKWMLDHKYCRSIEIANAPNPQGGRKPATDYEVNPTLL